MPDHIYLSCWLRGITEHNALDYFGKLLATAPVSRLTPAARLTIYAIDYSEPPVFEYDFGAGFDVGEIISRCHDFRNPDCAYHLETCWDLWQFEDEWSLAPAPLGLTLFAAAFPREGEEHFQIDLGGDHLYLPETGNPHGRLAYHSNLSSLRHLVDDISRALPLRKKRLWSESGDDLALRLDKAVRELSG